MRSGAFPARLAAAFVARCTCAAGATLIFAGAAGAAEIALANAWMRPIRDGLPTAMAYVDIRSDVDMKLVGASSPAARTVAIVVVTQNPDGTSTWKEVRELDIPAGRATRLAYNGSHLLLREIRETLQTGQNVPLELQFVDSAGKRQVAKTDAMIRGVLPPQPPEPGAQSR